MTRERWLPVVYKGVLYPGYEVSDLGRVRSHWRNAGQKSILQDTPVRILRQYPRHDGYMMVRLRRNGKHYSIKIHKMVLEAFVGPCPSGLEARHGPNGNLDNSLVNLSYGTQLQNMADRVRDGTAPRGEKCGAAKLTEEAVRSILTDLSMGISLSIIANRHRVSKTTIYDIRAGRTWWHLS